MQHLVVFNHHDIAKRLKLLLHVHYSINIFPCQLYTIKYPPSMQHPYVDIPKLYYDNKRVPALYVNTQRIPATHLSLKNISLRTWYACTNLNAYLPPSGLPLCKHNHSLGQALLRAGKITSEIMKVTKTLLSF